MLLIDKKILIRVNKGIKSFPFKIFLFQSLLEDRISAENIFQNKSKYLNQEFILINIPLFIENQFLKLIKICFLLREFDGQGLTSKVRITPIGRKALESSSDLFIQKKTPMKRLIT